VNFERLWSQAAPFAQCVAASTEHKGLWEAIYRLGRVPDWARGAVVSGSVRRLLVLAEDWCGDASNTVPVLAKWAEETNGLELRILRRDQHPDVMNRYLTHGSRSIPIVIVLDKEFRELTHWGPRPTELQAWVMDNRGKLPKGEFYPQTRRWYAKDHGETAIREVLEAMKREAVSRRPVP